MDQPDRDSDLQDVDTPAVSARRGFQVSLREMLMVVAIVALLGGYGLKSHQFNSAMDELSALRLETGYLEPSESSELAAVRVPIDEPLTYRLRVRVPEKGRFRIAYSTVIPKQSRIPRWYSAIGAMPGESILMVRIVKDPRDDRWKIAVSLRGDGGVRRMATVLPPDHVTVFRTPNDVISGSIGPKTVVKEADQSVRLLEEKWIVGENGLLLYGDSTSDEDQIGIYAELQPDDGPL